MKINGKTIPAPQNLKRREAFLLNNAKDLNANYLRAQLLTIALTRLDKGLKWDNPVSTTQPIDNKAPEFQPLPVVKKQGFISKVKGMFKSQRGN